MTPDELNAINAEVRDGLEDALGPLTSAYERILRRAGRSMARSVRSKSHTLTAAILPPDEDEVVPSDRLSEDVQRQTDRERRELVRLLAQSYAGSSVAFDVAPTISDALLEKVGAHATFAADEALRSIYRDVIAGAIDEGLSVPNTAKQIIARVDATAGARATAMARTDLIGLANGASQAAATEAFAGRDDVTKVWLATDDERTRDTHVDANGQEVPLNDYFDVGGYELMYPGDPDGPDEEVINCRCTLIYSGEGSAAEQEAEVASAWTIESTSGLVHHTNGGSGVRSVSYPAAMDASSLTSAVTVTVEDTPTERVRTPWEGILAIEGSPTSDGRYLIPGEIGARDLPLPIAASHDAQHETLTVGRIDSLEWIPVAEFAKDGWSVPDDLPERAVIIWGDGSFDDSEAADDAIRQLENGVGISLDLPMERQALIDAETYEEVPPEVALADADPLDILFGGTPEGFLRGMAGKIGGASLASIAAFEETSIRIVGETALVASGFVIRKREDDTFLTAITEAMTAAIDLPATQPPLMPPREWFFREEPDEPTPITILPSGEFFGHLALWHTCHAGRANGAYSACMYAPHSRSGYSQFHLGSILCDDGTEVPIGRITIGTGHAPLHLGAAAARKHYDHSGTCVAFARAKDGVFGIWLSGVIKSDATAEQLRDLRACPPSGDWRAHDGTLELQAALAVNVPGFPVPRGQLAMAASADAMEVNAMILGPVNDEDRAEALRAEYHLQQTEDVAMLVELGMTDDERPAAVIALR